MKKTVLFIEQMALPTEQVAPPTDDATDQAIGFYTGKLRQLEYVLNQLNLHDHPVQIQDICQDIVGVKKNLKSLQAKKKNLLSNQNVN